MVMLISASFAILVFAPTTGLSPGPLFGIGAALGVAIALFFELEWSRRRHEVSIELRQDHLRLPCGLFETRVAEIPYDRLSRVDVAGRGGLERLIFDTGDVSYAFATSRLAHPEDGRRLRQDVSSRVEARSGPEARRLLEERNGIAARLTRRAFPPGTLALAGVLVLAYAGQTAFAHFEPDLGRRLLRLGANARPLVRSGEVWRWISAGFLHVGLVHLASNVLSTLAIGRLVEAALGSARFFVVVGVSAILGAAASTTFGEHTVSVGASTMTFGLFGAITVLRFHFGRELPFELRPVRRPLLVLLAVNFALPVFIPQIDGAAHVGGFLSGLVVTLAFCRGLVAPSPNRPLDLCRSGKQCDQAMRVRGE